MSLETSIKGISSSGREAAMFTVAGLFPFKTCDVIDALPHASCLQLHTPNYFYIFANLLKNKNLNDSIA